MGQTSHPTDLRSFLAGIGNVCLQWALIEQTILIIIGTIENLPAEKAYRRYATLDMQPRLNMAINLAQEARWPQRLINRLKAIRKQIQNGLADQRNLYVHGAHEEQQVEGEFVLTMTRWKGDKQKQVVTFLDVLQLGNRLSLLAQEAHAVFLDYGAWRFGPDYKKDTSQQIAKTKAAIRLVRRQQIKRALKLLIANLKPW